MVTGLVADLDHSIVRSLNRWFAGSSLRESLDRALTTWPLIAILALVVLVWLMDWGRAPERRAFLVLGLGGAVQAGYKLAFELGYQYVIRVDGDGQHEAEDIPRLFEKLRTSGCEMVIGSRFVDGQGAHTSVLRSLGIRFFRMILRPILGRDVRDPTSGFVGVNRNALQVFSKSFPLEYPEIEALVVLQRKAFRFEEEACRFHPRRTGKSSITPLKSIYYIVHVLLGVFVNVLRLRRFR